MEAEKRERQAEIERIFHEIVPKKSLLHVPGLPTETVDCDEPPISGDLLPCVYTQSQRQPPEGWEDVFRDNKDAIFSAVSSAEKMGEYLPSPQYVFAAFRAIKLKDVRVVILGQDPYHQVYSNGHRATGMAFSQHRWDKVANSLENIYKEISTCYPEFVIPNHGDLSAWCKQGILLLNTCLTVIEGMAGSHGSIWTGFTRAVIKAVCDTNPNAIFVLWGMKAQKMGSHIDGKATRIESSHPSGLSARRGFFGSKFPLIINDKLRELGQEEIDWQV